MILVTPATRGVDDGSCHPARPRRHSAKPRVDGDGRYGAGWRQWDFSYLATTNCPMPLSHAQVHRKTLPPRTASMTEAEYIEALRAAAHAGDLKAKAFLRWYGSEKVLPPELENKFDPIGRCLDDAPACLGRISHNR